MTNSNFGAIIAITAGIIIVWLFIENDKKNNKIRKLQKEINDNENLTNEIKKRLIDLIKNNKEIDPKIANELKQIVELLKIKQESTAIMKLAKIIEKLLKTLYKGDLVLKELAKTKGRKTPAFADYLEHANNLKIITKEDYHLLSIMKIIRNEEAHELDIKKEKSRIIASFISGIGLILRLFNLIKEKPIESSIL